jgi:hypothetical protein
MLVSRLLEGCTTIYFAAISVELFRTRVVGRFLAEITILIALVLLALVVSATGTGVVSFGGGASPIGVVAVMFAATLFGIIARYFFYLKKAFSWLGLLKSLCISPIILLPLIGSVQGTKELEPMQVVSFALLAFQNGFFWEVVLERAKRGL